MGLCDSCANNFVSASQPEGSCYCNCIDGSHFEPIRNAEKTRTPEPIERVIEELREEYETAKGLSFVRDPVGYALYYTWKKHDDRTMKGNVTR